MTMLAGTIKSIETALDHAIHLEMTGKAFYENAKAGTTDEKLRKLFPFLIEQEQVHVARYKQLFERTTGKTTYQEALFGEYSAYIDLLLGDISGKLVHNDSLSVEDVLNMALGLKKIPCCFSTKYKRFLAGRTQRCWMIYAGRERIIFSDFYHINENLEKNKHYRAWPVIAETGPARGRQRPDQ